MIYLLDFRDKSTGGAVIKGQLEVYPNGPSGPRANDRLRVEEKVTFLVHGYNWDRPKGRDRLLRLARSLESDIPGALVAVLWPGDHKAGFLSYPFEGKDADNTAQELKKFISANIKPGISLAFVSHSLGGRVAMETVQRLLKGQNPVGEVCLMAPAINDFSLGHPKNYYEGTRKALRVAVLSSKKDMVLKWAYPAGNTLAYFPLFQGGMIGLALGYHGSRQKKNDPEKPTTIFDEPIAEQNSVDHGDYVLEFGPDKPPRKKKEAERLAKQMTATDFVRKVLSGTPDPVYEP